MILDPEEGIEAAVYAKNKGIDYSFKNHDNIYSDDSDEEEVDENGVKIKGTGKLKDKSSNIEKQFKNIADKFGMPKTPEPPPQDSGQAAFEALSPIKKKESVMQKAADRLSR